MLCLCVCVRGARKSLRLAMSLNNELFKTATKLSVVRTVYVEENGNLKCEVGLFTAMSVAE